MKAASILIFLILGLTACTELNSGNTHSIDSGSAPSGLPSFVANGKDIECAFKALNLIGGHMSFQPHSGIEFTAIETRNRASRIGSYDFVIPEMEEISRTRGPWKVTIRKNTLRPASKVGETAGELYGKIVYELTYTVDPIVDENNKIIGKDYFKGTITIDPQAIDDRTGSKLWVWVDATKDYNIQTSSGIVITECELH